MRASICTTLAHAPAALRDKVPTARLDALAGEVPRVLAALQASLRPVQVLGAAETAPRDITAEQRRQHARLVRLERTREQGLQSV